MKKKIKLITTIICLCISLSLLAFGVYAATTANFAIRSKISFVARRDVYLTFANATMYKSQKLNLTDSNDESWEVVKYYLPENANNWTTVNPDNSPLDNPEEGQLIVADYAFKNKTETTNESGEVVEVPAIYSFRMEIVFDIKHKDDIYVIEMETVPLDFSVMYPTVTITQPIVKHEEVPATQTTLAYRQLKIEYFVVLKSVDSNVLNKDKKPIDLEITFNIERYKEELV